MELLIGDSTKAKKELGWEPKMKIEELISEMVDSDMKLARREKDKLDKL